MIPPLGMNLPRTYEVIGLISNKYTFLREEPPPPPPWTMEMDTDRSDLLEPITIIKKLDKELSLEAKTKPQAVILKVCEFISVKYGKPKNMNILILR